MVRNSYSIIKFFLYSFCKKFRCSFYPEKATINENIFKKSSENPAGISGLAQLSEYHLTAKETEILKCLLNFQDNEEIAETLHIKETTLNKHLQNLFRKLEVRSRWELLRKLRT